MTTLTQKNQTLNYSKALVPTQYGYFTFYCFLQGGKENVAMVYGDINNKTDVLIRVHSECFTGDVIQSLKCDCGEQLDKALKKIAKESLGMVIYLKQEGRGIGLFQKLNAYELQDKKNMDTMESNLALGHDIDERSYQDAIDIISFFKLKSIRLITNNPEKATQLSKANINISEIVSLSSQINPFNESYLTVKKEKLNHKITIKQKDIKKIHITASYAQSMNGTISMESLQPLQLSNTDALKLTHKLRASHDAILIGINTLISDDPKLTLRYAKGTQPQPCIIDTDLKFIQDSDIFNHPKKPWFFTASTNKKKQLYLKSKGCKVFQVNQSNTKLLDLNQVVTILQKNNIKSVIVEGGKRILTQFLNNQLVDRCIITISPMFINGTNILDKSITYKLSDSIKLKNISSYSLADNIIIEGDPDYV